MPAIKPSAYNQLLKDISQIYTQTHRQARSALVRVINHGYWEIGKRIVNVEQGNAQRAQYGQELLSRLSVDLNQELGSGFSLTNLKNMRRFYLVNRKSQPVDQLEWSKQCVLLTVDDDNKRKALRQKVLHQKWTRAQLLAHLKKDRPERSRTIAGQSKIRPLIPKRGQLYIYKLIDVDGTIEVDCGFHITRALALTGIASPKEGRRVLSEKTRTGFTFTPFNGTQGDLYTYKAGSIRVVDGDTLSCRIDCGFKTKIKRSLRLRGINAPEFKTVAGVASKRFMQRRLKGVREIIFRSYGVDQYGRYVVDVFYASANGEEIYLNQELIDAGFAARVQ